MSLEGGREGREGDGGRGGEVRVGLGRGGRRGEGREGGDDCYTYYNGTTVSK